MGYIGQQMNKNMNKNMNNNYYEKNPGSALSNIALTKPSNIKTERNPIPLVDTDNTKTLTLLSELDKSQQETLQRIEQLRDRLSSIIVLPPNPMDDGKCDGVNPPSCILNEKIRHRLNTQFNINDALGGLLNSIDF